MRSFLVSVIAAMVVMIGLAGPRPALADPPSYDCTTGCYIVTCAGGTCTLWYCSGAQGCNVVTRFPKPAQEKSAIEDALNPDRAYAKVCPTKNQCEYFALDSEKAVSLGVFDNPQSVIDAHRSGEATAER